MFSLPSVKHQNISRLGLPKNIWLWSNKSYHSENRGIRYQYDWPPFWVANCVGESLQKFTMVKAPLPPPPPRPVIPQKVGLDTCESVRLATGHYEDDDCKSFMHPFLLAKSQGRGMCWWWCVWYYSGIYCIWVEHVLVDLDLSSSSSESWSSSSSTWLSSTNRLMCQFGLSQFWIPSISQSLQQSWYHQTLLPGWPKVNFDDLEFQADNPKH